MAPIEASCAPSILANEVYQLPHCQRFVKQGSLEVYWAQAEQIPATLREIGRLREAAFRAMGEGTGNPLDLDSFDDYYLHLFVWDAEQLEVVGAYRLGLADRINATLGRRGLYTYSLFKYSKAVLDKLNPALEVGRSFVRLEWQRNYAPLLLLWKGIGHFVVQRPQYRILFGPVSMSNDYHVLSQKVMVDFLRTNRLITDLADSVKPRHPLKAQKRGILRDIEIPKLRSIEGLSDLVSFIEGHERNFPVLLKQYLKLGGQVMGGIGRIKTLFSLFHQDRERVSRNRLALEHPKSD
jgi:hypothetical protein